MAPASSSLHRLVWSLMEVLMLNADLKNMSPRFKRLTQELTCALQQPDSLLLRKGKSWLWAEEGHMVEDPPWWSHPRTWW